MSAMRYGFTFTREELSVIDAALAAFIAAPQITTGRHSLPSIAAVDLSAKLSRRIRHIDADAAVAS